MSSTYRILCTSHDPAIIATDGEWSRPEQAEAVTIADGRPDLPGHETCDLLIGRWSSALIEVGCPRTRRSDNPVNPDAAPHPVGSYHPHDTAWIDIDYLGLVVAVHEANLVGETTGPTITRALQRATRRCWSPDRVHRLRQLVARESTVWA